MKMHAKQSSWSSAGMMGVALFIFIYEVLAYNVVFLGRVLPAVGKQAIVIPLGVVFNVIWAMGMWSYAMAHSSDPGFVPERWHEFVRGTGMALEVVPARAEWQPAQATFCRKCLVTRPERAHHCLICGMCVLRMDHHCPWINNCVGFYNHKFFILLGLYTELAGLVALASCLPELAACLRAVTDAEAGFVWMPEHLQFYDVVVFLIFGIVTSMVCGLLTQMMVVHAGLAARNSTSIEDQYRNMSNPFDQGSILANLAQIFGAYGPEWFIPIRPSRPLSDGIAFPCASEERLGLMVLAGGNPAGQDTLMSREDSESQQLWRVRYHVRLPSGPPEEPSSVWGPGGLLPGFLGCGGAGARRPPLAGACPA